MSMEATRPVLDIEPVEARLQELESRIDDKIAMSVANFADVGVMLREIRDDRLYRKHFSNFGDYLRDRWGMARQQGYRMIEAAGVMENLSPVGDILPASERVTRELVGLEPDEQRAVWSEVAAFAEERGLTATEVRRVIETRTAVREGRVEKPQTPALPSPGTFSVLYADPPWRYDHSRVDAWANENHYPTMDVADLEAMGAQVKQVASPDAVLFLWATSPKLPEAFRTIEAWGFTYKSSLVWVKHKNEAGMGYWFRVGHEFLLVATMPKASPPPPDSRYPSVLEVSKTKHSEKPQVVRQMIESMLPGARRLELFARGAAPVGWTFWGNQVEEEIHERHDSRAS